LSRQAKEEYDITVLSREEVTTYPKLGQAVVTVIVTYIGAGLPPHSINILKEQWNKDTERQAIRKDLTARLAKQPETYKV